MSQPNLMTAKEVKDVLRLPLPQVYGLVESLPKGVVVRIGRRVRFNRCALLDWMANGGHACQ